MTKTQMNFQGGVNRKANPSACDLSGAAAGEAKKQQVNFKCGCTPAKSSGPSTGKQMNFPNGS
jgi:hypothetical protein